MIEENSLGTALRAIRKARGLSQEQFSGVSSRTYLSSLERGLKNPTLLKLNELCEVLQVHPLSLLAFAYAGCHLEEVELLLGVANEELREVLGDLVDV